MRNLKQLFIKFSPWILDIHVPKFPRHTWPLIVETLDGILGLLERISFQVSYIIILLLFSFLFFFSFSPLIFYNFTRESGVSFSIPKKKKIEIKTVYHNRNFKKKKKKKIYSFTGDGFQLELKAFFSRFFFFFFLDNPRGIHFCSGGGHWPGKLNLLAAGSLMVTNVLCERTTYETASMSRMFLYKNK